MTLVTLENFKHQLGLPESGTDDTLLILKLDQATQLVIDYITRSDDTDQADVIAGWTPETLPFNVQAAILQWATELWRFRGDDLDDVKRENPGDPSPTVKACLARGGRRPVFA